LAPPLPAAGSAVGLPPPQPPKLNKHASARIAVRRALNIRRFPYFFDPLVIAQEPCDRYYRFSWTALHVQR
jgi:hypothetical protein